MDENKVRRMPKEKTDTPDGVELMAKCSVVNFKTNGDEVTGLGNQRLANCKLMASFENGVMSVSVRGKKPFMVSVRIDEAMTLLKEAADYHMEVSSKEKEVKKEEDAK